jgi:hypothetical protein
MATLISELVWWLPTVPVTLGAVARLYLVTPNSSDNRLLATVYQRNSFYKVAFIDFGESAVPFEFTSLDDAKAYARVTSLLTLKGNHEPIESHPLGR